MNKDIIYTDLGKIHFSEAWKIQQQLFEQKLLFKKQNNETPICDQVENPDYLLFCEHYPVYTLGKSGSENNLLVGGNILHEKKIDFFKIDRGGDITFHGPGQIVGYPILDLEKYQMGVKDYIFAVEEVIIRTLKDYDIKGERIKNSIGVWIDPESSNARKICAIGVKVSRYVSMHGFAFNINTDLDYYGMINPCGFDTKSVCSLEMEVGKQHDLSEVKNSLLENFKEVFDIRNLLPE